VGLGDRMRGWSAKTKAKVGGIAVLLLLVAWFGNPNCDWDTYDVRITDKQVKRIDDKDTYLVFSIDAKGDPHVFKDVDAKLFLKFNSSDLYAKLEKDQWYRIKTVGWRWGIKSWYENVLKVTPIPAPAGSSS
jgi:hypothetical protein